MTVRVRPGATCSWVSPKSDTCPTIRSRCATAEEASASSIQAKSSARSQCRKSNAPHLASDRGYSLRHKLQPAPIHIRRQNRNAHPFAFAHQYRNFFGVINLVREQTSHEFDRMVRL